MYASVKCKKCRKLIFDADQCKSFLNSHNLNLESDNEFTCNVDNVVFLSEESLPSWMMERIETEEWSKGRINCQNCDSRIGAFNFVSGQKCQCSTHVLPPVHLIKSKVDLTKR